MVFRCFSIIVYCTDKKVFGFFSYCSLDFEECAHKLLKMDFPESQTVSLFFVVAINVKQF